MLKNFLRGSIRIFKLSRDYKMGKIKLDNLPTRLWIEPTNSCNLKCVMCPQRLNKSKKGFMDFEVYKKIINEAKDFAIDINLFLGGESFMHPKIIEMIKYAKDNGLRVRFESNATLLTKKLSEEIIKNKVDFISFSFDGYTKEEYERIRVNANYEKTLSNILNFLKIKRSMKSKYPYTLIQIIEIKTPKGINKKIKEKFLQKFYGLPLNGFSIVKPHRFGGQIEENVTGSKYAYTDDKIVKYNPCPYLWMSMNILWDGWVVPCCIDQFGKYKIGNVKNESLKSMWNNKKMIHIREKLISKKYNELPLCKNCDFLWQKTFRGISTKNIKDFGTYVKENVKPMI